MKRKIALGLLLCVLLCGCEGTKDKSDLTNTDKTEDTAGKQEEQVSSSLTDDAARVAYYEQLVTELQQELLSIKTALFTSRVEYESRIAELEAGMENNGEGKEPDTTPEDDSATEGEAWQDFRYTVSNGRVTVTAYTGSLRVVKIPERLGGYPVCAIGDRAFADHAKITSIELPGTVKQIGWFAFSGCVSLELVSIPDSVEAISYGAFQNCPLDLTVICSAGSYAAQYAASYGLPVRN